MARLRDWSSMKETSQRLLEERTGKSLAYWNARVKKEDPESDAKLFEWLEKEGVTGYAAQLLVWERHLDYPAWMDASAEELIEAQYAKRPELRPIFDALVDAAAEMGELTVQARKTYVSLMTPRRTFARVQAKAARVDVALRLDRAPRGRLKPSKIHESMPVQLELASVDDLDDAALALLRKAYEESL